MAKTTHESSGSSTISSRFGRTLFMSAHASTGESNTAGRHRRVYNGPIQPDGKLQLLTAQGRDDPGPTGGRHQRFGTLGAAADGSRPDRGEGEKVDTPARSRPRAAAVAKTGKQRRRSQSATIYE